jgi:WD40 repeat protein
MFLVSGSRDSTIIVWTWHEKQPLESSAKHVLYGHNDEVSSVAASADLDVVLSSSLDKTCILHSLAKGQYIRSIDSPDDAPIYNVALCSRDGTFVIYTESCTGQNARNLHAFSINGNLLASVSISERLHSMLIPHEGRVLYTGGDDKLIMARNLHNLQVEHQSEQMAASIECIAVSEPDYNHLLVGLSNGQLQICTDPSRSMLMLEKIFDESFGLAY